MTMFYFRHPVRSLVGILGARAILPLPCSYLVHHFIIPQQTWGDLSYGLNSVVAIKAKQAGFSHPVSLSGGTLSF